MINTLRHSCLKVFIFIQCDVADLVTFFHASHSAKKSIHGQNGDIHHKDLVLTTNLARMNVSWRSKCMISEKFFPVCHNLNKDTAFICGSCSSELEGRTTDHVIITEHASLTTDTSAFIDTTLIPEGGVAIYIEGAPKPYYLSIYKELILGRKPDDATVETVLDLTSLAAFNMGVSRRHAMIRRAGSDFDVLDLASRNRTWLNVMRLAPNKPYRFASGSQLRLAQMPLFIMYNVADTIKRKK